MGEKMVPKVGLEPTRSRLRRILSPLRLPFRHFGLAPNVALDYLAARWVI